MNPPEKGKGSPPRPPTLAVYSLNDCTRCAIRCGVHGFAMDPCELLLRSTAPYYREARVTVARRQTACGMRHCCARRIVECPDRRELLRTSTRWAERHPQGVCRIRKAAEPPTAAQQRIVGAEANRIAASNAATPRYGQCNRQALQLFELLACNVKTFLLGDLKGGILFCEREWPPLPRAAPSALLFPRRSAPLKALATDLISPET